MPKSITWEIKRVLAKHFPGVKLSVRKCGGDWYEIFLPEANVDTLANAERHLALFEEVYRALYPIENEYGIVCTVT